jgi:hypothetical protein
MVVFDRKIGTLLIRNTLGDDDTQNMKIVENKEKRYLI